MEKTLLRAIFPGNPITKTNAKISIAIKQYFMIRLPITFQYENSHNFAESNFWQFPILGNIVKSVI